MIFDCFLKVYNKTTKRVEIKNALFQLHAFIRIIHIFIFFVIFYNYEEKLMAYLHQFIFLKIRYTKTIKMSIAKFVSIPDNDCLCSFNQVQNCSHRFSPSV